MMTGKLPSSWQVVELRAFCKSFQAGFARQPNDSDKGILQLRMPSISRSGFIDFTVSKYVDVTDTEKLKYAVQKGDVIFNNTNSPELVGNAAVFDHEVECVLSNHMTRIRVDLRIVNPAFLAAVLHRYWKTGQTQRRSKQWINQAAIDVENLASFRIPLPPLSEQQRIAEILQEAEEIRRLRAEAEAKTAELIPAIFFEHFKYELLSHHSHTHRLADFCVNNEDIKCGPFGTQLRQDEFTSGGVPLWGIKHVNSNFKLKTDEFISPEKADELAAYSLKPGDIVMTRKGTIGNCAIYPDTFSEGIMHSDLLRIRVDTSRFTPLFLSTQLGLSPFVEKQINSQSIGAVMPGINVTRLKELKLFVVDSKRQQLFADEVREVAALLSLEHLSRLEESHLLASLSAHAFSGQLTADWRDANKDKLAAETQERDAALKETGAAVFIPKRLMAEEIEELLQDRTDGIYADLNREQRHLLQEIKRIIRDKPQHAWSDASYFTAEQLAADIRGALHRHPQRVETHLAVLAARGLIIPVSLRRMDNTGPAFAACYRLSLISRESATGIKEDILPKDDDRRLTGMEALRRLANSSGSI